MNSSQPVGLTEEEHRVFAAVNACETSNGASPTIVAVAAEAGIPVERARLLMHRLTGGLGLVVELPGRSVDRPLYRWSGRLRVAP